MNKSPKPFKLYIFFIDMSYAPDENFEEVVKARDIGEAWKKLRAHENLDRSHHSKIGVDDRDWVDYLIEIDPTKTEYLYWEPTPDGKHWQPHKYHPTDKIL